MDLTSEDDDDPAAFIPNYPGTRASLVGSAFSRASLSASNTSNVVPSARPLVSGFAYNAAPPNGAVPTKRTPPTPLPQVSQNEGKSTITAKARIPRQPYVGPSLDAPEEPIDEELEFEKFKMRTRMAKIVEFHEAAALAEISLSIEMYKARKQSNNSKEEDAPRVLEHQKRMVQLQKEKEEERKAIVKSERARRQSELVRRSTLVGDDAVKGAMSNGGGGFKTWDPSSFQEEINLPSRFNLETLLSEDPDKQQTNVESLLSEMFADGYSAPDNSDPSFFNTPPHPNTTDAAFHGSSSSSSIYNQQEQFRQSMSWNKTRTNSSPQRKTHLSPFGESSDDEEDGGGGTPASFNKPNAPKPNGWLSKDGATPVNGSAWKKTTVTPQSRQGLSSSNPNLSFAVDDIEPEPTAPVNGGGAWNWNSSSNSKKTTTANPLSQSRQGLSSNPNLSFGVDDIEPEPTTATSFMNSKAVKGKRLSVSASDKSPILPPPTVDPTATASNKAPVAETPAVPPTPAPALAPGPAGKKQNKKQRQAANKKGGAASAAAPNTVAAAAAIPEQEPETEPILSQQRESPTLETSPVLVAPIPQTSEHTSWLPKTAVSAMAARARRDSQPQPPSTSSSFSWDEVTSTPRPASKIPAHVQESLKKAEGATPRPMSMVNNKKKNNLMAEMFSATSSRTTLEHMPPPTPISAAAAAAKGPVWGSASSIPTTSTPGPSLWGKTKADFETVKPPVVVQQQQPAVAARGDTWVPGGFDGVDDYKNEGDGGGGGGGNEWGSITSHSNQQNGKTANSIPVKQSIAAQRLRRVSEATASSSTPAAAAAAAPRGFGTKDLSSDIGKQQQSPAAPPTTVNSNSKKAQGGKKNGKGKQRATVEVVSDEEKDNIDFLPQDSSYIMEPKVILEPKPSVPPFVYNPIIDFAGDNSNDDDVNEIAYLASTFRPTSNNDDVNEIAYLASTFRPTAGGGGSTSSSSQDDFFGGGESWFSSNQFTKSTSSSSQDDSFGGESRFSNPFGKTQGVTTASAAAASAGGGGGGDWGSTIGGGGKHARWTPAVTNLKGDDEDDEDSGLLSFSSGSVGVTAAATAPQPPPSRLQQSKSGVQKQQTPVWGQPNPSGAKDKGKGKK